MDRKIKVLIVDDQRRSRQSLKALLATWPDVASIREAANGVEALRKATGVEVLTPRPDEVRVRVADVEYGDGRRLRVQPRGRQEDAQQAEGSPR